MVRRSEQQRMKQLLSEAITVLCKASLPYHSEFTIEGLLGITLDGSEIVLVNINEIVQKQGSKTPSRPESPAERSRLRKNHGSSPSPAESSSSMRSPSHTASSAPSPIRSHPRLSDSAPFSPHAEDRPSSRGEKRRDIDDVDSDISTKRARIDDFENFSKLKEEKSRKDCMSSGPGGTNNRSESFEGSDFGSHLSLTPDVSIDSTLPGCSTWDSVMQSMSKADKKSFDSSEPADVTNQITVKQEPSDNSYFSEHPPGGSLGLGGSQSQALVSRAGLPPSTTRGQDQAIKELFMHANLGLMSKHAQFAVQNPHNFSQNSLGALPEITSFMRTRIPSDLNLRNSDTNQYECPTCGKRLKSKPCLDSHMIRHSGKKFGCTICNKTFLHPIDLRQHQRVVHGEKKFVCPFCGAKYATKQVLKSHLVTRHNSDMVETNTFSVEPGASSDM